jgi:hypothetical protein
MANALFLGFRASIWFAMFVLSASLSLFLLTMVMFNGSLMAKDDVTYCSKYFKSQLQSVSTPHHPENSTTITGHVMGGVATPISSTITVDPEMQALSSSLGVLKVCRNQGCDVFASSLMNLGVHGIKDFLKVTESEARAMMSRAGMSILQQNKVVEALAPEPFFSSASSSSSSSSSTSSSAAAPSFQSVISAVVTSGMLPRMDHNDWKLLVSTRAALTRNFTAALYSRWTWYNYRLEWFKDDYKSYTPRAAEWDLCMTGVHYCVVSFGMYALNAEKLEYYTDRALLLRAAHEVFFPGWRMRIYYDEASVPQANVERMSAAGIDMVKCGKSQNDIVGNIAGMFWRFYVANDLHVDRYMVRDLDSNLNWRERAAVDEWILSGIKFHLMRDTHDHATEILGGMWGGVKGAVPFSVKERALANQHQASAKGGDQFFLTDHIWPVFNQVG